MKAGAMAAFPIHLLTAALCLVTGQLAHVLVGSDMAPLIFWPPAGIGLGAALVWGPGVIPAAFLGTFAAAALWDIPWLSALLLGLAVAVQAWVGTWLLRRAAFPVLLPRVTELLKLVALGGAVAGGLAAILTFIALRDVDWFWETSFARCAIGVFCGHLLSTLVFAPLLICRPTAACPKALGGQAETIAALVLVLVAAVAMAHPTFLGLPESVFRPYPLMPFLLWLAMRSTPRDTALGIALIYGVVASTNGWGQGHLFNLLPDALVLPIHGFVFVMGLSFMALAVLMVSRSLAERALRSSEARLRNVIGLIRNCLWETDGQGRFVYLDQHADSVFGLPADAMLGRRPEDIWPEGLGPAMRELFGKARHGKEAEYAPQLFPKPDGSVAYLETSCASLRDECGRHLGWQGITREVSDRVRMARDLDETNRRFRQLAENVQEVFWVSENLERFVYISPQCEKVTGLSMELLYKDYRAWQRMIYSEDRAKVALAWEGVTRREPMEIEFRAAHPDKGLRWFWVRSIPFEEAGGVPMNAGLLEDVTDRKRAEFAHIEQAIAQRDALIREVHHRIKNNLQTVVGLLRREVGKHPEAKESIESAIAQVQSVAVVHGLHGRVTQHTIMLCELLPAIVNSVSELSGVPILFRGPREGCGELRIKDNETVAVALILNELATNAVKHSAEGDEGVEPMVTMAREGDLARSLVQIRMINRGRLPEAFDFSQGVGIGTGLGLVRALMPTPGMSIAMRQVGDNVEIELEIEAPVLTPVVSDQLEFGKGSDAKDTDRR
jgi:PAS domain S-box-containing protein